MLLFSLSGYKGQTQCISKSSFVLDYKVQRCGITEFVLYTSVGNWHFGQIGEDSGLRRCRIREFQLLEYMINATHSQ